MEPMESLAANDETLGQEDEATPVYQTSGNQPLPVPGNQQQQQNSENHLSGSSHHRIHWRTGSIRSITRQPGRSERPKPNFAGVCSSYTPYMEDKLCRRLKFFFMGPHEKITAKRKCPWKLLIQIAKIVLVTIQLIQFGYSRSSFVEFSEKSTIAMEHMYLQAWDSTYETMPYPAAIGKYALYTIGDLIDHMNFASCKYDHTEQEAIGSLRFFRTNGTVDPMKMCMHKYKSSQIRNNTYTIDSTINIHCYSIGKMYESGTTCNDSYDIVKYMEVNYNITLNTTYFDTLLLARLKFKLKSFRLEMKQRTFPPQLFEVHVSINFDDENKDGQMLVTMDTDFQEQDSDGVSNNDEAQDRQKVHYVVFDCFVLLITVLSIMLCSRSVVRAQKLRREVNEFFKKQRGKSLSVSDQCEFLNLWYVTIIINDILTIFGTAFKILLETRKMTSSSSNFDYCGLMLGTGSLLAWLGVLRYIGYFQQFNILIVTLKRAFPNMMRFLTCCILLYIGFVICGWVVLGPYHIKFREISRTSECLFALINGDDIFTTFSATVTDNALIWYYSRIYIYLFMSLFIYAVLNLFVAVIMDTYESIKFRKMSTASECLFSLINGDDMFVTFSATMTKNGLVWYYSRIYLYGFISLFIYAVLNLFIAVIMDTYETIKEYYEHGFPKSEMFQFIDQCQDPVHSPIYRREDTSCNPLNMCCCCGDNPDRPNEYTSLIQ